MSVGRVVDAVYNTGIHLSEDPNVEYAVAVYIRPYPNNIFSLWVYIATLKRKAVPITGAESSA